MAKTPEVVSHWHHSTEGLSTSALEFYSSVERSLNVKKVPIKAERIDWREAGLLSTKREYLRLSHDRFVFDVCAAPFGQDFFFSWWLGRRQREFTANSLGLAAGAFALLVGSVVVLGIFKGLLVFVLLLLAAIVADRNGAFDGAIDSALASLPFVGAAYERIFHPITYYSEDSRQMFEDTVHRVVMDSVSGVLSANGMSAIPAEKQQPQLRKK